MTCIPLLVDDLSDLSDLSALSGLSCCYRNSSYPILTAFLFPLLHGSPLELDP